MRNFFLMAIDKVWYNSFVKLFGFRFQAKREPRYPSYAQFEALSEIVASLSEGIITINKAIEAIRKQVYREKQKTEVEEIIGGNGQVPKQRKPIAPGEIMTAEQIRGLYDGN